jgi:hypothetical protein
LKAKHSHHIIGGDVNSVQEPLRDTENMQQPKRLVWKELDTLFPVDTFRALHSQQRSFTRIRGHPSKSRIDRILHTVGHPYQTLFCEHIDYGTEVSDHMAVRASFLWPVPVFPLTPRIPNKPTPHPQSYKQVPATTLHSLQHIDTTFLNTTLQSLASSEPSPCLKQCHLLWQHILDLVRKRCKIPLKQKSSTRRWKPADYNISNPSLLTTIKSDLTPQTAITSIYNTATGNYVTGREAANHAATVVATFGCSSNSDWDQVCQWIPQRNDTLHLVPFPSFQYEEVTAILRSLPAKKTSGPDQVPAWVISYLPDRVHLFLAHYCNLLRRFPLFKNDQRWVWVKLLYKFGDPGMLSNY